MRLINAYLLKLTLRAYPKTYLCGIISIADYQRMEKKPVAIPLTGGKSGTKRSLLTEGDGMPLAVEVEGANRHDMKLVESTLEARASFYLLFLIPRNS